MRVVTVPSEKKEQGSSTALSSRGGKPCACQAAANKFRTKFVRRQGLVLTKYSNFLAAMRLGETPVPIPNTTVKT